MSAHASSRRRRRPATRPSDEPDFAAALIEAREEAGMSQRELAERLDVSNSTIASLERGADAQWSTLAGLLGALPGLAARELLPNPYGHPPAALAVAWRAHRDLVGFECDHAEVTLRAVPDGAETTRMELRRVRLSARRVAEPLDLTGLMRMVSRLPPRHSIERLDGARLASQGRVLVEHEGARHEFVIVDEATRAFDYRAENLAPGRVQFAQDADALAAASLAVTWPVRRVKLVVETTALGDGAPIALAWIPAGMSEPWASDLLRYLHPGQRPRRHAAGRSRRAELNVDFPPIGVVYALRIAAGVDARKAALRVRPGAPQTFEEVGRRLADVRIAHDLSIRQLAREMKVAASTIFAIESGIGGRMSLLGAYLRRFRELAPQDLLPPAGSEPDMGRAGLWRYAVRLFGFATDEITKLMRVRNDGFAQISVATRGLRVLGRIGEPVRLRTMVLRLLSEGESLPPAVSADSRVRRRLVHHDGEATWEFVFPRDLAEQGANYRRTYPSKRMFSMTAREASQRHGGPPPYVASTTYPTPHPLRRLTLDLRFPAGYFPRSVGFSAWPQSLPPSPDEAGLKWDLLDTFAHDANADARTGRVVLRVERPIPGIRFVIWWILPD